MQKKVVVTGASGFLGSHVRKQLMEKDYNVIGLSSKRFDLRRRVDVAAMYEEYRPDIVIHLAAVCGGIGANMARPANFFYDNMMMGLEMIDLANQWNVEKFVQVGTVCGYPKHTPSPFKEEDFWNGYPEETNAPYGIAKKALLVQCQAYRQQYGLNAIYLVPVNLYGPGDNFDLQSSHVIPALIRKCLEAKAVGAEFIGVWGTGSAYREFLYVEDCAKAIVLAMEKYDGADPVNIGTGDEISMRDLVSVIKEVVGYEGSIKWDPSKPDGQPRRRLDTTRATERFGFTASTSLKDGLRETIEWYTNNKV